MLTSLRRLAPDTAAAAQLAAARATIADESERLTRGSAARSPEELAAAAASVLAAHATVGLASAINATGVIVHTNLGRAPWPAAAIQAVADIASDY
ncbi:MAG TPA: hypothetical protein VF231_04315, partial [Candidatus Limnocylindrales bacterium]